MFEERVSEWIRRVELTLDSDRQSAIVDTAIAVREKATPEVILELVLLAHSIPSDAAFSLIREEVVGRDSTFGCAANDLEARLIAGVCVAALLEAEATLAIVAAHAVQSAGWSDLVPTIADIPTIASECLVTTSEHLRSRAAFRLSVDVGALVKTIPAFPEDDGASTHNEVAPLATALTKTLESVKRSFDQFASRASARLAAADEELDLLWWAFAGNSSTERFSWAKFVKPRRPLIIATEFVDLLRFKVEPPSTHAILFRLLGTDAGSAVSLADAVEDLESSNSAYSDYQGHRLLPILSCMGECVALEGRQAWRESVSRWGIDAGHQSSQAELAMQAVRELLLRKSLG